MKLPQFSLNRPVTTTMALLVVVVLAMISLSRVPVNMVPDMDYPAVVVMTKYPGVGPEEIEKLITEPIEEWAASADKIKRIKATSLEGISMMMIEFAWEADLDAAAQDVRNRVEMALDFLPEDVDRPLVLKIDFDTIPVVYYGVISKGSRDLRTLKKLLEDTVQKRLQALPNVASAAVVGSLEREIIVEVDRDRLRAHHLGLLDVLRKIDAQNVDIPGGHITRGGNELIIRTMGKYKNIEEIKNTILAAEKGSPIYVRDVAGVWDGHMEVRNYARTNLLDCAFIMVSKEPAANNIVVVDAVEKEMEALRKTLPPDLEIHKIYDQSTLTRASVAQLKEAAAWGALFAMGVIFIFLWNVRTTLILSLTIPFSILAAGIPLYYFGQTINMMSLSGIALAIGMVVDDGIVVLENIFRHMQQHEQPRAAALTGANEVGMAVTASTLTTVIVFLPMALVTGVFGILVRPLGLTVVFSVLASLIVALTLIPMLIPLLFKKAPKEREGRVLVLMKEIYKGAITWTLRHRLITVAAAVLIFGISLYLFKFVGQEFIPKLDEECYTIVGKLAPGTSLEETNKFSYAIEKTIMDQPEVYSMGGAVGISGALTIDMVFGAGPAGVNEFELFYNLVPKGERKRSGQEIIDAVYSKIPQLDDAVVYFMGTMDFLAGGGEKAIEIKVFGKDLDELRRIGDEIEAKLMTVEGATEFDNSMRQRRPEFQIQIDREKASQMGISVENIAATVQTAFLGKKTVNKYREGGDEYDIRVRLKEPYKKTEDDLRSIIIPSPSGFQVHLREIADIVEGNAPAKIEREEQQRVITISANVSGRDLGSVMKDAEKELTKLVLPEGYSMKYGGAYEDMKEMEAATMFALILVLLLVYMVMAALYEAFLQPFGIMLTIPLSLIGIVSALMITGATLSLSSIIGILMVIGIVTKNGIILVDYIDKLREGGMDRNEAIVTGGSIRLRPILMTALATMFGCVPMAVSHGEGAELFAPIGITVLGGLTTSTFLTLLVMPALYSLLDDLSHVGRRLRR
jgi:HAE1 family hydrophobic/amphiphilic exporter-1